MTKSAPVYFPLGTRCSSAIVIKDLLHKRKEAYPFDWVDISLDNLLKFLFVPREKIAEYLTEYFKLVDPTTYKHPDGTWFPHDFPEKEPIAEKYLRRFKKMYELFDSGREVVFVTVLSHYSGEPAPTLTNRDLYYRIIHRVSSLMGRFDANARFVSINITGEHYWAYYIGDNWVHFDYGVPLGENWKVFHKQIARKILEHV